MDPPPTNRPYWELYIDYSEQYAAPLPLECRAALEPCTPLCGRALTGAAYTRARPCGGTGWAPVPRLCGSGAVALIVDHPDADAYRAVPKKCTYLTLATSLYLSYEDMTDAARTVTEFQHGHDAVKHSSPVIVVKP